MLDRARSSRTKSDHWNTLDCISVPQFRSVVAIKTGKAVYCATNGILSHHQKLGLGESSSKMHTMPVVLTHRKSVKHELRFFNGYRCLGMKARVGYHKRICRLLSSDKHWKIITLLFDRMCVIKCYGKSYHPALDIIMDAIRERPFVDMSYKACWPKTSNPTHHMLSKQSLTYLCE